MDKNAVKNTALGGIIQNPIFVLVLGMCPLIATSISFMNALLMGLCTSFVLIASNFVISLLRKVISDEVRLPAYILIIATFVTIVQLFLDKFMPDFYESVKTFIALIVVNCIILGRAEAFAGKNNVLLSVIDGVSMGLGFTFAISLLGAIRQLLGGMLGIEIFLRPAGGFIVLGCLMAMFNAIIYYAKKYYAKKSSAVIAPKEAA